MTRKKLIIAIFSLLQAVNLPAQTSADEQLFDNYAQKIGRVASRDSLLVKTALYFVHTPYVAKTLEVNETEQLVINLRELDCATFVDNVFALTRTFAKENPGFESFRNELQQLRYRGGMMDGYVSRLHYTTDWIFDNEQKGIVRDKTKLIGGKRLPVNVSFMSSHPSFYPLLKNDPAAVDSIRRIEKAINSRPHYFIPKNKIASHAKGIATGDVVCFATKMRGLDTSHVGIAYWLNGQLTFIHASLKHGKVIVNPESLVEYCMSDKNNLGIIVVTLNY
jgi:hypothetical protein